MAIEPETANELSERELNILDETEAAIDAALCMGYLGPHPLPVSISPRIVSALVRRYVAAGWRVRQRRDSLTLRRPWRWVRRRPRAR